MKDEKETRRKLLESAKKEFGEKGFLQASLRNICKNAGVTTGALYFFFRDKDDLFVSLVKEPLLKVYAIMQEHFQSEKDGAQKGMLLNEDYSQDVNTALRIVHELYQHREEFLLLLTKAQGSSLENVTDHIADISNEHYRTLGKAFEEKFPDWRMKEQFIHWIAHMQTDIFIYTVTHIETEEEAKQYMRQAVSYLICGWYGMFGKVVEPLKEDESTTIE